MAGVISNQVVVIDRDDVPHVQVRRMTDVTATSLRIRMEGGGMIRLQFGDVNQLRWWLQSALRQCDTPEVHADEEAVG